MKNALITLTLLAAALPAAAATITLNPSTLTPLAGQNFSVDVIVENNDNNTEIDGFGFNLTLSPSSFLSLNSVTLNPLFSFTPMANADVAAVLNVLVGPTGAPVTLATLHFLAGPGSGAAAISIASDPGNPDQGLLLLDLTTFGSRTEDILASVNINIQAVPEPATVVLSAAGLACVALLRRRAA